MDSIRAQKFGLLSGEITGEVNRFWSHVVKGDGCWLWVGPVFSGTKRGQFKTAERKTVKAYRYSYQLVKGKIPDDLTIDHLCRNPNCVKPDHLEAVTAKENRARVPRQKFCKRGHERIEGTRRCNICSIHFRPGRLPARRRELYLAAKERAHAKNVASNSF